MTKRFQPIYDIAALCAKKKLTHAILCPGSRSAPLVLAFSRHPDIRSWSISDERSAAFLALGMARQTKLPTVLVCTSGTAAYNFAPAVAEAFFSHTPLIIFTADRPSEWIAQQDGQTIYQSEIFGKHVKKSFQLPIEYEHPDSIWGINRILNEAINLSLQVPAGPVHINAPFREPLYPGENEPVRYSEQVRIMHEHPSYFSLTEEQKATIASAWPSYHNILVVAGQQDHDHNRIQVLIDFFGQHNIPIVGDIISNMHPLPNVVKHTDVFLGQASDDVKKTLRPGLLVTFGGSVISKNLKLFLRNYPAKSHWHIQAAGTIADTFKSITNVFRTNPNSFFNFLRSLPRQDNFENQKQNNYTKLWEVEERRALRTLHDFFPQKELAELELVNEVIQHIPDMCNLHLANSMSVRYANYIGLTAEQKGIQVFSNRGTSGIDGCNSTAMGHALTSNIPNILITGDLAFFYDRNAFWHNYPVPDFRVVLLNNHGGIIFKMIDGPEAIPEADEFFSTRQQLNAKKLCEEFDFEYLKLDSRRKLKNLLKDFFEFDGKTKVLELETTMTINKTLFDNLKQKVKKSYEL
jgi:2-succinyl-5-enolpyruvyl-6-hydroxy-3-cyclohexene-1-carboxylate synthase